MPNSSVKKNFLLQVGYQLLIFLIPLIVAPYLTRILGSDGLGNYSYVNTLLSSKYKYKNVPQLCYKQPRDTYAVNRRRI